MICQRTLEMETMPPPAPELDLPECPVCLQSYDGDTTTPRVLACGHSACETCLKDLPKPYPHTLRCPACTQLVNFPHPQGPSALPKNIDLLRLIQQNPNPAKPTKPNNQFVPNLPSSWAVEFRYKWKQWILPEDAVVVESSEDGGFLDVFCGRVGEFECSLGMSIRCLMKCHQKVSLVKVGLFRQENDSRFRFSYINKIVQVLCGMKDGERSELDLILGESLTMGRTCKIYGLWYNKDDEGVYMVCGRHSWSFLKKLEDLESGFLCRDEEKMHMGIKDMSSFAMIGGEMCETVRSLLSDGFMTGCLAPSWFDIDDFGHFYIDFNEVLVTGRRVRRIISEALSVKQKTDGMEMSLKDNLLKPYVFVSPELLFELFRKEGIDLVSSSLKYAVGYGSDVWSLCCALLWLLLGKPFIEELENYLCCFIPSTSDENGSDFMGLYMSWLEKVKTLMEMRLDSEFVSLKEYLYNGLDFDPARRPLVADIWKSIRELIIKPNLDLMVNLEHKITMENTGHCLVLGELCQPLKGIEKDGDGRADVDQIAELRIERDFVEGVSAGHFKCIDLKGHRDCITGLAVGGGFLFSSSFDKTVSIWSLEDLTHLHSFKGHEHRVMALVFVDEEQPLCISGDNGGGICIWGIGIPFAEEPIKKLYEEKDWRYSGIHALAVSGTGYLYTGSGDKSIKAWSMLDYTQSCTMNGHKSVVSTLAVCNGVLYSGSWDGTVRLWCLSDHSPLTVLGEDTLGNVASVLSIAADGNMLIVAHENGSIKIWSNDALLKSTLAQNGAILSVSMEGKWLFTGGWSKTISVQELSGNESQMEDVIQIGSIACDSVVTSLLYRQGKLFVGQADRVIKDKSTKIIDKENLGPITKSWTDFTSLNYWVVRDYYRLVNSVNAFELQIQRLSDEQLAAKTVEFRRRLGEGETLADVQAVVTVNDYLAQRDAEWMGRVHRFLGLSVGLIQVSKDAARYPVAAKVAELLIRDLHYNVELKENSVELTEDGIALAEMALETNDLWDENDPWARFVMNALKAKEFYRRDVQYIVKNGKALIVNELTGRVEEKRRWSDGLHQAVEAKEGVRIQADTVVVAQITYQSLFKLYPKLSGMTGTAKTEENEFLKMFQTPVVEVPTNLPNIRKDLPVQAFTTARGKWKHIREEVEYMFRLGRPVLVGTTSVENSEYLSALLTEHKIPHNVLNARPKYAAREAEIVAQAGRQYAITLATNMAGRGTDIILGGNPKMLAKEVIEDSLLSFMTQDAPDIEVDGEPMSQKVMSKIKVGPSSLALLAKSALMAKFICKSEGKRWTYQEAKSMISESVEMSQSMDSKELESLVNEQSEVYPLGPSIALAYQSVLKDCEVHCFNEGLQVKRLGGLHVIGTSLHESRRIDNQDEMFQKFNFDTEWAVKLISSITNDEDIPIEHDSVLKQLEGLQIKAEKFFFNIRKSLVEFDEVLEHPSNWNFGKLLKDLNSVAGKILDDSSVWITEEALMKSLDQLHELSSVNINNFHLPNLPAPPNTFRGIRRKSSSLKRWLDICSDDSAKDGRYRATANLLRKYLGDFLIASYLEVIQESGYDDGYVKEIEELIWNFTQVNVRSFGHRNPLEEYKIDGCRFFISMLSATRRQTVESLLRHWSSSMESQEIYV
ncbi:hypothetical protein LguiB_009988 [Lonicera macranthoides]